jgi:hypothetical protein
MVLVYVRESLTNLDYIEKSFINKFIYILPLHIAILFVSTYSAWAWYKGCAVLNYKLWNRADNGKS